MKKILTAILPYIAMLLLVGIVLFSVFPGLFAVKGKNGKGIFGRPNKSGLTGFSYVYQNAFGTGSYSFEVDGGALTYKNSDYPYLGAMTMDVDGSLLKELDSLALEHKAYRWDGYDKQNTQNFDGTSYRLEMKYTDGGSISCQGSNAAPRGFTAYRDKMVEIISKYFDPAMEKARDRKKAEGITGKLISLYARFAQHGESGLDKYEVFIVEPGMISPNYRVEIDAYSDEIIEGGVYSWGKSKSVEECGFDKIQELLVKYDIIQWLDFHGEAEDPLNTEEFEISFSFDNGDSIRASGTLHPANYDEFRKEFLSLVVKTVQEDIYSGQ